MGEFGWVLIVREGWRWGSEVWLVGVVKRADLETGIEEDRSFGKAEKMLCTPFFDMRGLSRSGTKFLRIDDCRWADKSFSADFGAGRGNFFPSLESMERGIALWHVIILVSCQGGT